MSTTPSFQQVLGQTEKALNAILDRELAATGLTEPHWVTLTLAEANETVNQGQLIGRVAHALKVSEAQARTLAAELASMRLLELPSGEGSPVKVTPDGRQLYARVRAAVSEITRRVWGDLATDDLVTATRVLSTVLWVCQPELAPP